MTIKKKLFLSHILMYVVPILVTMLMAMILFFAFIGISGDESMNPWNPNKGSFYTQLDVVSQDWTNETDIDVVKQDINNLISNTIQRVKSENLVGALLSFVFLIIIIFITSTILTKLIFRSITSSIETLAYGVRQIRDGNLKYRIEYSGNDEFSTICEDFNEMAIRLSDFVEERVKNEENRKELIAGISHDLRTPLTTVKAYLEGIERGVAKTPEAQKYYFDIIKGKTIELERIINQLFMFSKIDLGEFPFTLECIGIKEMINESIGSLIEEYEKKGLTIQVQEPLVDSKVQVDLQQFRNAITNIVENSLKYKNKDQGNLVVSCIALDNQIILSLTDDGDGVSEEALAKLFHIFYRTDESRSKTDGSGIGLAITSKILERMGGSIKAENAEISGLSIRITLPIVEGGF